MLPENNIREVVFVFLLLRNEPRRLKERLVVIKVEATRVIINRHERAQRDEDYVNEIQLQISIRIVYRVLFQVFMVIEFLSFYFN